MTIFPILQVFHVLLCPSGHGCYSKSEKEAGATVAELKSLGRNALACRADVADDGQVRNAVEKILDVLGGLDILVNSAGTTFFVDYDDLEGLKEEHWDRIMGVNVKGCFQCCRAAAKALTKARGCIVNISSVAGVTGIGSSMAYSASKAAVISLTKSLALTLAPHVRVNSVAPGIVTTRWVEGRESHIKRLSGSTPLKGVATPEDVAQVVVSLVANARFVTGQTIVVDGGAIL
jgi:3-oxoacyl-[acyl-carrier protein] reductase